MYQVGYVGRKSTTCIRSLRRACSVFHIVLPPKWRLVTSVHKVCCHSVASMHTSLLPCVHPLICTSVYTDQSERLKQSIGKNFRFAASTKVGPSIINSNYSVVNNSNIPVCQYMARRYYVLVKVWQNKNNDYTGKNLWFSSRVEVLEIQGTLPCMVHFVNPLIWLFE